MKLNHAIKKIAAVGTGAMLLGVSAAAVSADLSDYPEPFVMDGMFSGNLVIGEAAATSDVIGAIEVATSLQAAATTPVSSSGGDSQTVLEDSVRVASGSDNLLYGQDLDAVKATLTDDDLDMLADVEFEDEDGTEFDAEFRIGLPDAAIVWDDAELDSNDDPAFYVDFSNSDSWNFDLIFPDAINISEFDGESIDILGEEYTFGQGDEVSNANSLLTLYKSGVKTTIDAGSPETVLVDGEEVEITVIGANTDSGTATISVNGEAETVEEGDYVTVGGVRLYIDDVFIVNIPTEVASVRVFVGADKIILEDGENVVKEVDGDEEDVEGTSVSFSGGGSSTVSQISISFTPGSHEDDFSPVVNDDVAALLMGGEYVDPVFDQIKFAFTDIVPQPTSSSKELISLYPSADDEFSLEFANYNGQEYDFILFRMDTGGDADLEYNDDAAETYVLSGSEVDEDNRFIVRDDTDSEYTRVVELTDVDNSSGDAMISLKDIASGGETRDFSASQSKTTGTVPTNTAYENSSYPYGTFSYDGFDFGFLIVDADTILLVDPTSAAAISAEHALGAALVTENGAELGLPTADFSGSVNFTLTEETDFNNADVSATEAGQLDFVLTEDSTSDDNQLRITDVGYNQTWSDETTLESDDDLDTAITIYGTYTQRNTDSTGGEVEVYYPADQTYYNVFVGPESAGTAMGGSEGEVVGEVVNAIQVGSAILDTEAAGLVGSENLLVVGGPCVNSVAAELMGNPDSCTEGFTQGSAWIKLWSNNDGTVSLMVAGYDAADTRLASRVLANYAQYEGQLVGDEVVVSGTSISNVDISAPTVSEDDSME